MSIELRLPNIGGNLSEKEMLMQIRSYLYQIVPQLQFALNNVNTSGESSGTAGQAAPKVIASQPAPPLGAEITFDKLKPLIIKSSEIVTAYYEEINKKLQGVYVATSDFGTFVEKTKQDIEKTSTYTNERFESVQAIFEGKIKNLDVTINSGIDGLGSSIDGLGTSVDGLDSSIGALKAAIEQAKEEMKTLNSWVLESRAHIKTGIIDTRVDADGNEFPVYGIEIGQIDTANGNEVLNRFARFTSGKLSFYDQNNTEVAYISDYKLYIRKAEITISLKVGGLVDTVMSNGDVVTKWVGGEG